MSTEQSAARESRPLKFLGAACFGGGLLITAVGILLILLGILNGPWPLLLVGILAIIVGLGTALYGMILLYRGLTAAIPRTPATEPEA
ncbi:hypothetical protein [Mycetocola spongiae]|uniref:hypothetical protein n=1 Tax=Mycetocola spongiae TaxID=2859226 RepID=UPI001CF5C12F|nr:hypothetical protein [Mycetocola spongiae]UCR88009.1 hypothetical protein KXZ72_08290 [Mycetocola spongiae]